MRLQKWAAALLTSAAVALAAVVTVLLAVFRPATDVTGTFLPPAAGSLLVAGLGVVIAWRVPRNPIGPLLSWTGATGAFLAGRPAYESMALAHPGSLPLDLRVVVLFEESGWWLFVAVPLVLLFFPDGRLPGPRWRFVPWALVASGVIQQAYGIVEPLPFLGPLKDTPRPYPGPPRVVEVITTVVFAAQLVLALACAVSLVVRYRKATGVRRKQLTWLAPAGVAVVAYPLVCGSEILLTGSTGPVALVEAVVAFVAFPAAIAIAMLRHDLYDVDRVLAATLTYGIVSLILAGAFAGSMVAAGLLLGRGSAVAAAVATPVAALLLAPVRRRVQRFVDDRFYPPRRAAQVAVDALQARIHAGTAEPEELQETLRVALRDPGLRVVVRLPGTGELVGRPVVGPSVPVELAGERIGLLASAEPEAVPVLRAVVPVVAGLVEVIRLRAELASALQEVRESRLRLVQAGNAERVRLEHDLHDSAQQRLVALGMGLRIAQLTHSDDMNGVLDHAVAELTTAVAELRQIAHGLRPSSLDDGLHAALSGMARLLPIPVQLEVDPARLPDDLATTAYYVACEAVTNAAKHARADQVAVRVDRQDATLRVRVTDDGCGGATVRAGSGLAGLTDRVAAFGGSLSLHSPSGGGTVIEAVLPCAS